MRCKLLSYFCTRILAINLVIYRFNLVVACGHTQPAISTGFCLRQHSQQTIVLFAFSVDSFGFS